MPARLRPTAAIATDAILVGDPGRALLLAQALLEQPKMSNHARGLWGYSGRTAAGTELTVQSTGMGGPSAALVLADLAELGLKRAIRVGTATGLDPTLAPGDLVVVVAAHAHVSGAGAVGGASVAIDPDLDLTAALAEALGPAAQHGAAASLDALHPAGSEAGLPGEVADMQTAALLAAGTRLGVALAAVLIVTATTAGELDDERAGAAAKKAGAAAAKALSNP